MTLWKRSFWPNVPIVGVNMNWPRISSVCDLSELAGTSGTREYSTNTHMWNIEITKTHMDQLEAVLLRIICVAFSHVYPTAEIVIPSAPVCRLRWWRRIQSQPSLIPTKIARNLRKHWKKVGWNNPSWNGLPTFRAQLLPTRVSSCLRLAACSIENGCPLSHGWKLMKWRSLKKRAPISFCVAGSSFCLVGWISV